jgi:hypothetical protein
MTTRDPARPRVGEAAGMTSAEALGIAASRLIVKAGRRVQHERRPTVARYQLAALAEVAADVLQICSTATGFEMAIREVIAELPEPVRPGQPRKAAALARQRWEQQFTEAVTGRLI